MTQTGRLAQLLQPQEEDDYDGAWFAIVAQDVSDANEPVWVTIPEYSENHVWGPGIWQGNGQALPQQGDLALVIFDNRRNLWMISWWSYTDQTGETSLPPPKTKYPPSTAPPASGILKNVGATPVDQQKVTAGNGTGLGGGGNVAVTQPPLRGVIHDTEGAGDYNGTMEYSRDHYPPNFIIGSDGGKARITQFYPLGISSDATIAHDFEIWCQIEVMAPSGASSWTAGQWRAWLVPIKDALQQLMAASGVPMIYRGNPSNRGQNWSQAGWFGHIDVPDNDHTDPGAGFPWSDFL